MIFAKSKNCRNFYLFMVFFFSLSLICISGFSNSNGGPLSEIIIILYFGIYFFITGLSLLIILVYYYTTRFKKLHRKFSIEGTGIAWILSNLFILGFLLIYLTDSREMIILGLYFIIKVSLISIAGIAQWLYDRKNREKEKFQRSIKVIENSELSIDKLVQVIKKESS